ncbi:hypothetical protein F1559_004698 [Cyanidiococcus yangmingshanensis]|uniref:Man1/Src1-like C-terminal domain-containing protein n=1 Tax=Cyanidiococcus yangmingshanensis TaxID=2690220 RepID=A0A7J7IQH1_9RHOD|nr:hypothetical protein F1559_004698 [Cyanidiococcus yangmingshanensis]
MIHLRILVGKRPAKAELVEVAERVRQQLLRRETKRGFTGLSQRSSPRKRREAEGDGLGLTHTAEPRTPVKFEEPRLSTARGASPLELVGGATGSGSVTTASTRVQRTPASRRRASSSRAITGTQPVSSRKRARRSPLRGDEARRWLVGDDIPEDRSPDGGAWADLQQTRPREASRASSGMASPAALIRSLRQASPATAASTVTTSPSRRVSRQRAASMSQPLQGTQRLGQAGEPSSPTPSASSGVGISASSRLGLREAFRDVLSMVKPLDRVESMDYIEFPEQVLPTENDPQAELNLSATAPSAITPDEGETRKSLDGAVQPGMMWHNRSPSEGMKSAAVHRGEPRRVSKSVDVERVGALPIQGGPSTGTSKRSRDVRFMGPAPTDDREGPYAEVPSTRQETAPMFSSVSAVDEARLAAIHQQVSAALSRIREETMRRSPVHKVTALDAIERGSIPPFAGQDRGVSDEAPPSPETTDQQTAVEAEAWGVLSTTPQQLCAPSPLQAFRQLRQERDHAMLGSGMLVSRGSAPVGPATRTPSQPESDTNRSSRIGGMSTAGTGRLNQAVGPLDRNRYPSHGYREMTTLTPWSLHTNTPISTVEGGVLVAPGQAHASRYALEAQQGKARRMLERHWRTLVVFAILTWFALRIYLILPSVPYCDSSDGGRETIRGCRPCPEKGICVGGVLTCREGYVVLGGKCALDRELNRYAHVIQSQIHRILSESAGRYQCGERAIRWKWTENELRDAVEQLPYMERIVHSGKWEAAFRRALDTIDHPVARSARPYSGSSTAVAVSSTDMLETDLDEYPGSRDENRATTQDTVTDGGVASKDSDQGDVTPGEDAEARLRTEPPVLYWSVEAHLPLWCRVWRVIEAHLGVLLWANILFVLAVMLITRWRRRRQRRRLIEHLQREVYRRLQEQKQQHLATTETRPSESVPPFLVDVHLRDELVGDMADVSERQQLWQAVIARVRSDSRIHLRYETFADGRRAVVWEWTAPLASS